MNVFNEEYEQNELITNDIKVTSSLFKKIYKFFNDKKFIYEKNSLYYLSK